MEVPHCPNLLHAGSKVVRAGWYGKAPHRRQRWWCEPTNGDERHRFTPTLTRQTHPHAAPNGYCLECSTAVEPWEGQAGARDYLFAAREVGDALAKVAQGSSYRAAAESARIQALRVKQAAPQTTPAVRPAYGLYPQRHKPRRMREPQMDGQLVANWVDVFTDVICAGLLPTRWPDVLVVDAKGFVRGPALHAARFNVLGGSGIEEMPPPGKRVVPKAWTLQPYPTKNLTSWKAFFSSLEGTPKVIVSDADLTILKAIDAVFPRPGDPVPEHRLSEWHMKRRLDEYLPPGHVGSTSVLGTTYGMSFTSSERWAAFVDACEAEALRDPKSMVRAMKWLGTYGDQVTAQAATRRQELPNSTGPIEAVLKTLGERIGARSGNFTNRARMTKLLMLITADLRQRADGRLWADRLRERIYLAGGHPWPQRPHDDPKGIHSLLA